MKGNRLHIEETWVISFGLRDTAGVLVEEVEAGTEGGLANDIKAIEVEEVRDIDIFGRLSTAEVGGEGVNDPCEEGSEGKHLLGMEEG